MKKSRTLIVAPLLLALLAFSPANAQESKTPPPSQENSQAQQLTLKLESKESTSDSTALSTKAAPVLPKVKELQPRPHGRSRFDPAPPPKPLIEVKRL